MPTSKKSRSKSRSRSHSRHGGGERVSKNPRKRAPRRTKKKEKPLTERTLSELQMVARSHGIPFGGLTRTQLIEKIVAYR